MYNLRRNNYCFLTVTYLSDVLFFLIKRHHRTRLSVHYFFGNRCEQASDFHIGSNRHRLVATALDNDAFVFKLA